ncbi:hypothetical protein CC78DRAFT_218622 [Lojkania enalia]|uniref:AAA+ ATPase domain-containing protein n=1 Tax=Lojkania enalia TaxID=147567 RepID=A0A9P4N4H2_9PLEO|nr:hypothetical protein CC78DRAFT_218622 [Didymosphaeria enalia]
MALAAVCTAMNLEQNKTIHPFFTKPSRNPSAERSHPSNELPDAAPGDDLDYGQLDIGTQAKGRKKRPRKASEVNNKGVGGIGGKSQALLERFTRQANGHTTDAERTTASSLDDEVEMASKPSLEEDPNQERRKRRKTASPSPTAFHATPTADPQPSGTLDWHQQLQAEAEKATPEDLEASQQRSTGLPFTVLEQHLPDGSRIELKPTAAIGAPAAFDQIGNEVKQNGLQDTTTNKTAPKKIIKVTRNGRLLLSPPKKKKDPAVGPTKKRGRKPAKSKARPAITVIKYGSDTQSRRSLGEKIEDILNGRNRFAPGPETISKLSAESTGPPKPTHPFFIAKATPKNNDVPHSDSAPGASAPKSQRTSAVTPGKLRAESRSHQSSCSFPAFGPVSRDNRAIKQLGTIDAPWPSKSSAHVHNFDSRESLDTASYSSPEKPAFSIRKQKNNLVTIRQGEDLLTEFSQQLNIHTPRDNYSTSPVFKPSKHIRLPTRLLTTGVDIQERVRHEIHAPLGFLGKALGSKSGIHPVLVSLFRDIENTLTPFDRGECENQSWVQKYAPTCASHVLQQGREAVILRDWMKNLTVMSVGGQNTRKPTNASEAKRLPKTKRKKSEDDFVLFSDEEDEDLAEISNGEDFGCTDPGFPRFKSLKRPRFSRNKNVIILSGPHGCGKSATVYAVAKELGFEVFEINSSSRRSGKDIQDKVGDMSENHLVNHKRGQPTATLPSIPIGDAENELMSTAFQKDLETGRQGTMTSFFKSNPQLIRKPKQQPKPKAKEPTRTGTMMQATLLGAQSPKSQKQSLILIEEADVFFAEDQQFWPQIMKLASLSKRPIVITCTIEALIPAYDLPLGAVLRFAQPPADLAVDYMLLLAAREGHILKRKAVHNLFESKDHDLRASITELDFWCQMSVGDRKGGLEWIYQRWPPGKDVDANGRILRVASEGTYQSGMGFISHDVFQSEGSIGFGKEEVLLKEAWTNWGFSPTNCEVRQSSRGAHSKEPSPSPSNIDVLKQLDLLSDAVSAADIYCRAGLPTYENPSHEPTDSTTPPISEKERSNYTEAARVLQTDHVSDFSALGASLFVQSHLNIQRAFRACLASYFLGGSSTTTVDEDAFTEAILRHKLTSRHKQALSRSNFSEAFDILATPAASTLPPNTPYNLNPSCFDRTFKLVIEDLAPFVRTIVTHELRLKDQKLRLSNLLSEGGPGKRARSTRASRVALEGGKRETKRRENWFDKDLNRNLVMTTAGKSWSGLGAIAEDIEASSRTADSLISTQE